MIPCQTQNLFTLPRYTRTQAIKDGLLIDVSDAARKIGFKIPLSLTFAVWEECVEWDCEDNSRQAYQDQSARLNDVLRMTWFACQRSVDKPVASVLLNIIPRDGQAQASKRVKLKAVIGSGDAAEPVLTIMLPGED